MLGQDFADPRLKDAERKTLLRILEILARDIEVGVRVSVAKQLKDSPLLPRRLAIELASDIEQVATPILQSSDVLTEEDLLAVVSSNCAVKNIAIANRPLVSETVSTALIDTKSRPIIGAVLGNNGAEIAVSSYDTVIKEFGGDEEILDLVGKRPQLPITIVERLTTLVADELVERIVTDHNIPEAMTKDLVDLGRESALVQHLKTVTSVVGVEDLVLRLKSENRLTATLILRALVDGDIQFFECAMSALAGSTDEETHTLPVRTWTRRPEDTAQKNRPSGERHGRGQSGRAGGLGIPS